MIEASYASLLRQFYIGAQLRINSHESLALKIKMFSLIDWQSG